MRNEKRLIFESATIAGVVLMLSFTVVFAAYPGPDQKKEYDYGSYGSWVASEVEGIYLDETRYHIEKYESSRGSSGSAEPYDEMWYVWFINELYESDLTWMDEYGDTKYIIGVTLAATYTYSEFEFYGQYWSLDKVVDV